MDNDKNLKLAFTAVYDDLVAHGEIIDAPGQFENYWHAFKLDLQRGFDDLFPHNRQTRQ